MSDQDLTWPSGDRLFRELPLAHIESRPTRYTAKDLNGLKDSIGLIGLIHPLTVVKHPKKPDRFELVAGAGRYAAAKAAGLTHLWCAVLPHTANSAAAELAYLHENIHRVPLTQMEHDAAVKRMRAIEQELNAARTTAAANRRRAEAGRKAGVLGKDAGKLGGRGKKAETPSPKSVRRGGSGAKAARENVSDHASAAVARMVGTTPRAVQQAVQRLDYGAPSVLRAYGDGKLTRQQVTLFSRLEKHEQAELLPVVLAAGGAKGTTILEERLTMNRREAQDTHVLLRDLNRLDRLAEKLPLVCRSILRLVRKGARPEGTARLRMKLERLSQLFREVITELTPEQ